MTTVNDHDRSTDMSTGANLEFWRNRRVFLTGHTGFKGSWLSLWLQELGAQLVGYSLAPPTEPNLWSQANVGNGMVSTFGDILDVAHLQASLRHYKPEVVLHLAAQSIVRRSFADPINTFATNVLGTVNVLEAVRHCPSVRSVIIVTSDKCYENKESLEAYKESDRLGGFDPYSSSKACAELATAAYRLSFFSGPEAAGIASVRAGNVIGGGDWTEDQLVPDIIRGILAGKEILIRNPQAVRPWQHVMEPLYGYLLLAEKLFYSPTRYSEGWNFGPEESDAVTVIDLLQRFSRAWGPGVLWRQNSGAHLHEAQLLRIDCSKAKTELDWCPQWDLNRLLEATAEWYKAFACGNDLRAVTLEQIHSYQKSLAPAVATAQ